MTSTDTSPVAPDEPVDRRAAALANVAATADVAYSDAPLTDTERAAAVDAGISVTENPSPAAVRQATAEAGTGTPDESVKPAGDDRSEEDYDPAKDPAPEQTPAELAPADRDTALEALLGAVVTSDTREVKLTGDVVDLGGELERVVVVSRYNAMMPATQTVYGPVPGYAMGAKAGDVVLVTEAEAARGEKLNALAELPAEVDAGDDAVLEVEPIGGATSTSDDELRAMGARDLIAYVASHPDEADRVVSLEEERPEDKRRTTVLALTDTGK